MPDAPQGTSATQANLPRWRQIIDLPGYIQSRGSALLAALTIIAGQAWLANDLSLRPVWLLPALSAVPLIISLFVFESDYEQPNVAMRLATRAMVIVLAVSNAVLLGLLVHGVFVKSPLDALGLLIAGIVLWVVNMALFALAYWEIDAGGPEDRLSSRKTLPDLVFPQQTGTPGKLAPADWQPSFTDYLYVSLTASTAFSPTDALPYTKTAKLLMAIESTISFAIVVMLVARAVNVAKG